LWVGVTVFIYIALSIADFGDLVYALIFVNMLCIIYL